MRDISSDGMMVVGALAPTVDQGYKISIVLPESILDVKILQLDAICRWHTIDVRRGFHMSGFQCGELADHEQQVIEQIQAEYEFSTSDSSS